MVSEDDRSPACKEAEAAAWLARLNGPYRTEASERAFRRWREADPAHEAAFERATEVWELVAGAAPLRERGGGRPHRLLAVAAGITAMITAGGLLFLVRAPTYETAIGERQVVMLEDGTRVSLNTDSEITVWYSERERMVSLDHGEAMFEVAKSPGRPFVVTSGDEQVRALGTTFLVRRDENRTAVTLLEGKIEVIGPLESRRKVRIATLSPGQRVTVKSDAGASLDTASAEAATAWQRGEVVFEDTTLIEVAEEMNRYSEDRLIIADPSLASLRVSGVFSTSDPEEVAKAIAALHQLKVREDGGDFRLTKG